MSAQPTFPNETADLANLVPWVAGLSTTARLWLADCLRPLTLASGAVLFRAGERSDALYVVLSGRLALYEGIGGRSPVGFVGAGDTLGEISLLTGREHRAVTVRAVRDCELLRLDRADFEELIERDPRAPLALARPALERASQVQERPATALAPRTLGILSAGNPADLRACARALQCELSGHGPCALIDVAEGGQMSRAELGALESRFRYVLFVGDGASGAPWNQFCARQSDALVVVAPAGEAVDKAWPSALSQTVAQDAELPIHVVLRGAVPGAAANWLARVPRARVHRVDSLDELARVARLVVGRATGLVLSGGGARGFAHLGVIRALAERGWEIDTIGGTSIGAIIGAALASGWEVETIIEQFRRWFTRKDPLSDWTLPLVSLFAGRRMGGLLREAFGETCIEDLSLPFYCVSANLTEGRAAVHRSGPLARWLRASAAIPGVLPPVLHQGQVHADGGVIDNLPVEAMGVAGRVIAVDVGGGYGVTAQLDEVDLPPWWRLLPQLFGAGGPRRPGIFRILLRSGLINSDSAKQAARRAASLLIVPPVRDIELMAWKRYDQAVEAGYRHALEVLGSHEPATVPSGGRAVH